jgi:small subunit ribosomal protein S11
MANEEKEKQEAPEEKSPATEPEAKAPAKEESAKVEAPKEEAKKKGKKEKAEKKPKPSAKKKKSKRRSIAEGDVHIQASYNNTIITVTEPNGDVISWATAGSSGFKGARKATPYAAQISAENALQKAKIHGIERVHVYIKGVGSGREQAMRGITANQVELLSITDVTSMPHNGCRKKKRRRV